MPDLKTILDRAKVPDLVKADAWDSFHGAATPEEFTQRLNRLPLGNDVKAELWDAKYAAPSPRTKTFAEQVGVTNPIGKGALDFIEGAGSGAANLVFQGGDLIRRGLGMERVIQRPEVQQLIAAPDSIPGKAGRFAEQAAEMIIPGSGVARATKAAPILARVAAQAATGAGVAGLQTGGDKAAMGTAAALGGASEAIPAALTGTPVPGMLKESAAKQYGQVINATKQGNKWVSQNVVVPELIERGVKAFTLKGLLQKAEGQAELFGKAIGDKWANLPAGTKVALDPIIQSMTKSADDALTIQSASGAKIPATEMAKNALGHMNFLKQTLKDAAEANPSTGALEVPAEKLRALRQAWDEVAANAKVFQGQQLADHAVGKVHAMASDAIREKLAADFPDIAALNKEYSFWRNTEKVIRDTVLRREGQAKPMSQQIAAAAGVAMGGAAGGIHGAIAGKAALEGLQKVMASPAWRTVSSVYKDRLADAIATGNRGMVNSIAYQITKGAGTEVAARTVEVPALPTAALQPPLPQ